MALPAATESQPVGIYSREQFAAPYLRGSGLEIGALHFPFPAPADIRVTYVDRLSLPELRQQYPALDEYQFVPPDIIADGEHLHGIADDSQDFIIANHFLEHCEDPIGTLLTFHRVLRSHGIAFLTVPDKRFTFDKDRPVTSLEHLQEDHMHGTEHSRKKHYEEWVTLTEKVENPVARETMVRDLMKKKYSIHFHVWTDKEILELLSYVGTLVPFSLQAFQRSGIECMAILKKTVI